MNRKLYRDVLAAVVSVGFAGPGVAQLSPPPMDMTGALMSRQLFKGTLDNALHAGPRKLDGRVGSWRPGSPESPLPAEPAPGSATTRYTPNPAVTARTRREFLEFVSSTSGPVGAKAVAQSWARLDPEQAWAQFASPDGLRLGDVADAMAEYWALNWMMASRVDATPGVAVRAVRDQVRAALSHDRGFQRLTDDGRQHMAETLIYDTMLQGQVYREAISKGDRQMVQRLSDAAEQRFRNEMHMDLRGLRLTDHGFAQG